ncbi:MAG: sigma 54-interacting transcriptional regulator [Deltaproteobacteria bacterium]|nr:sigma 54-interacting transcriptional regulator [Deltaproteobacteria bacterium]
MPDQFLDKNGYRIIDSMTEGLLLVNPSGKILYTNNALEQLLHYEHDELIGKNCEILQCDSCFGPGKGRGKKYCDLFQEGEIKDLKCTFRRKDGTPVFVRRNATTLRDETGAVLAGAENLTDLSVVDEKDRLINMLQRRLRHEDGFQGLIGRSEAMRSLFDLLRRASRSDAPVILYGEKGTGKKLAAAALHRLGARGDLPFARMNCAVLQEDLLENELFGRAEGALAGACAVPPGRLALPEGGDIFLDEIGDMPHALQTRLLRVLQEREIAGGEQHSVPARTRLISATSRNLTGLMKEGRFREDLYYRIGVIPIFLPPLREKKDDLPVLIASFIENGRLKTGKEIRAISRQALDLISQYNWPGNVRELMNAIEYAFVLCPGGEILPEHLPAYFASQTKMLNIPLVKSQLHKTEDERQRLLTALKATNGNKSEAARILGVSRVTLWKYLKKYQIEVSRNIQE